MARRHHAPLSLPVVAVAAVASCVAPVADEHSEGVVARSASELSTSFARLPEIRGDLLSYVDALTMQSSFTLTDETRRNRVMTLVGAVFRADASDGWCAAVSAARAAQYSIHRFYDEGRYVDGSVVDRYFVVLKDTAGTGQATFVLNPSPARNLVIEAPHSDSESATRSEGAYLLRNLGARALLLNGANRCRLTSLSTCYPPKYGTVECGWSQDNYRRSDVPHWPQNTFHAAHVALEDGFQPFTLQLHGFWPVDHWVGVVSDGTPPSHQLDSVSVRFRDLLRNHLPSYDRVGSCQDKYDGDHPTLCGYVNLQGHYTNEPGADACSTLAETANGRFVHLEQTKELAADRRYAVRMALRTVTGTCIAFGASDCQSPQYHRAAATACP
jgi:hypothetical protein